MPYLNLDVNFFDHRKTKRLTGILGRGAEVLPLRLWCYTAKYHAADGKLTGYSAEEVESAMCWWGQRSKGVEAMITVGFLERCQDGYVVKGWEEHEGHIVYFHERAVQAANKRWHRDERNASSDARGMLQALPLTIPDQEEKKKEKERKKDYGDGIGKHAQGF